MIDLLHHILNKATTQGKLHPLPGSQMGIRASLYADYDDGFCSPIKEDIQFLAAMLTSFGESTGLSTNCIKRIVAPIRCANVDLDDVLQSFPACRSSFPIRYLGLPLAIKRLRRIHLQMLEDKAAGKLAPWKGKHVAISGRMTLVKAALTAVAIYHITPLDLPVEVLKAIDRLQRA